ncbi:MAG: hypothetical protein ACYCST_03250 [Acidimicrobiales bacterium]
MGSSFMMRRGAAMAASVILFGAAGAGFGSLRAAPVASHRAPPRETRVFGIVQAGPTCPVETTGHPCAPRPLSGVRVEARAFPGLLVAATRTRHDGLYVLVLGPGAYVLSVSTIAFLPRCPRSRLVVATRPSSIKVNINCDTGIR